LIKRLLSRFSLFFVFSFFIFNILLFNLGLTGVIIYTLWRMGILAENFYVNPSVGISILLLISTIISVIVAAIGGKLMINPICEMLESMKKLAGGDFNVRIDNSGLLRPKELSNFSDEFNAMAKELGSIEILRSDFVNNFSHEFKTPIVSLRGFAKLLKEGNPSDEERQEYLDIIISESDRLAVLATNVLNLSKIENLTLITGHSVFDLSEQIRRAILMTESRWMEKKLELEVDIEEDIHLRGNPELLSQVWVNLLDNAVKFSHQGGKLRIRLLNFNNCVVFKVQDFGCGMDEEVKAHIFDKFYQGDISRATGGNGLGMTLVKKIVSLHKGEISVESQPGQGTIVTIILPKQAEGKRKPPL